MQWLVEFSEASARTDRLSSHAQHAELLVAGLLGEAGSILAELKKEERERKAYPGYRRKLHEEIGDFLWYYVRLTQLLTPNVLQDLSLTSEEGSTVGPAERLRLFLRFAAACGGLASCLDMKESDEQVLRRHLFRIWSLLVELAAGERLSLESAARENMEKTARRWPEARVPSALFDEEFPEHEQLPRRLEIEFRERDRGGKKEVVVTCNGEEFGDSITDNIAEPDYYRFHDIFHFSFATLLGWSPVVRKLLRRKRKSVPEIDESEDGARAYLIEEAISAVIYSRAKNLRYFEGLDRVDYDLLKTIEEFTVGFEVETVPLWQWEQAILLGYQIFRYLRDNKGGRVVTDLTLRKLDYFASP